MIINYDHKTFIVQATGQFSFQQLHDHDGILHPLHVPLQPGVNAIKHFYFLQKVKVLGQIQGPMVYTFWTDA
jgi:hypothetical protein